MVRPSSLKLPSSTRQSLLLQPSITVRHLSSKLHPPISKKNGRHIIITGATRGIGLAIAQRFLARGDNLCIIGRNNKTLSALVDQWNAESTPNQSAESDSREPLPRHNYYTGDVGRSDVWGQIVAHLGRRGEQDPGWNAPDVLVNAAGVSQASLLVGAAPEDIRNVVDTNLMGCIWGSRFVGKMMLDSRRRVRKRDSKSRKNGEERGGPLPSACIVNVASLMGLQGGKGAAAYTASKAGVLGLTRALAGELGPKGIRVNAIVPGYVETMMTECECAFPLYDWDIWLTWCSVHERI